jgi:uncharacterized membrane-anchored protein YjiN (DUF445 family)
VRFLLKDAIDDIKPRIRRLIRELLSISGMRDKMSRVVDKAFDILIKNLDNKDEKIQLAVAMQILRLPALQENLKSKAPTDRKTIEAERVQSALSVALGEVTKEMGY